MLLGDIYNSLENRDTAIEYYKLAVRCDVECYDAIQKLRLGNMLTTDEAREFLASLDYSDCGDEKIANMIRTSYEDLFCDVMIILTNGNWLIFDWSHRNVRRVRRKTVFPWINAWIIKISICWTQRPGTTTARDLRRLMNWRKGNYWSTCHDIWVNIGFPSKNPPGRPSQSPLRYSARGHIDGTEVQQRCFMIADGWVLLPRWCVVVLELFSFANTLIENHSDKKVTFFKSITQLYFRCRNHGMP